MQALIKKSLLGLTASANAHPNINRKYPPYGKKLDDIRRKGLIPIRRVIIATDWHIGKLFPRIIITDETPINNLKLNYLSGLHVQIAYFDHDEPIISALINEILAIQPASLAFFNFDAVMRGEPAFKMIFSKSIMEAT